MVLVLRSLRTPAELLAVYLSVFVNELEKPLPKNCIVDPEDAGSIDNGVWYTSSVQPLFPTLEGCRESICPTEFYTNYCFIGASFLLLPAMRMLMRNTYLSSYIVT